MGKHISVSTSFLQIFHDKVCKTFRSGEPLNEHVFQWTEVNKSASSCLSTLPVCRP